MLLCYLAAIFRTKMSVCVSLSVCVCLCQWWNKVYFSSTAVNHNFEDWSISMICCFKFLHLHLSNSLSCMQFLHIKLVISL